MQGDLAALESFLTVIEAVLGETFDGVVALSAVRRSGVVGNGSLDAGRDVFGEINNTIGSDTEHRDELQAVLVHSAAKHGLVVGLRRVVERCSHDLWLLLGWEADVCRSTDQLKEGNTRSGRAKRVSMAHAAGRLWV